MLPFRWALKLNIIAVMLFDHTQCGQISFRKVLRVGLYIVLNNWLDSLVNMVTVGDFYQRWEGVEAKLLDMTTSPLLCIRSCAESDLQYLYQMKQELDEMQFEPSREVRGIRTDLFGVVSFEDMERFIEHHWLESSQKYMLEHGAIFSDD